ncbi:lyase family protein [Donghicola tyrosinivorans]|uniref:3-carboxy-cis,cis-muconate cycloisomerase n=1 Tax=Donghicola tyrosinivorans TaxID=1652492 RepID=A0A2T0WME0_9RHOB|nr:lyase family protein [Donghicola tyrosinivorans]PRY87873.1 3-carboxy-cis,cis-muconate cycloisomerase [Donghicola tyrosinivorans]
MTPTPLTGAVTAPLYGDPEATALLSEAAVAAHMVSFEVALARATEAVGLTETGSADAIAKALDGFAPDLVGLGQGTASAGVPVPALVAQLRKACGPEGQALHWGATSQDVVDTATVMALRDVLGLFAARLPALIAALKQASEDQAETVMAGRTRSQIATPITLGLRAANWAAPLISLTEELPSLREKLCRVQFGGAAGNNLAVAPHGDEIARQIAEMLGLFHDNVWHSDRNAVVLLGAWCARVAAALAKMASDLVVMGRSEAAEGKAGKGGGSSTMPQKANPVGAEAIVTLAAYINGLNPLLVTAASPLEERDGAKWALEWFALPQILIATAAALRHGQELATSLQAFPDNMARMLEANGGAVMSEAASFALAAHMPRADAQGLVKDALKIVNTRGGTLADALAEIGPKGIDWAAALDPKRAIAPSQMQAAAIFARAAPLIETSSSEEDE